MARHSFSGDAVMTNLSSLVNSSATTLPVNTLTGTWPNTATGPFVVTLDRGTVNEEKCLCSSYTPTALTVTRGYDGTTAITHQNGATVEHTLDATQINLWDSVIAGVGQGTPTTSAVGDVAADGTNVTQPAAGDHKHGREAFGVGQSTTSAVGDAAADGSQTSLARSDHKHGREGFGVSQSSTSLQNDTASDGVNTTLARSDHKHARETVPYGRASAGLGQTVNNGVAVQVSLSQILAAHGMTFASNVFTVPKAGIYRVMATMVFTNPTEPGNVQTYLTQNGLGITGGSVSGVNNAYGTLVANQLVQCAANDTIGLEAQNNLTAGGTFEINNAELDIEWVGPV